MEEKIRLHYKGLKSEDEKRRFIGNMLKEIDEIYKEECDSILSANILTKEVAEQKKGELTECLKQISAAMRTTIKMAGVAEKINSLQEQLEASKQDLGILKLKAQQQIKREQEEKNKIEKITKVGFKNKLRNVRDDMVGAAETVNDLANKIIEGVSPQEMIRSVNNIMISFENSSKLMKNLELWPEEEDMPRIENYSIKEINKEEDSKPKAKGKSKKDAKKENMLDRDDEDIKKEEQITFNEVLKESNKDLLKSDQKDDDYTKKE